MSDSHVDSGGLNSRSQMYYGHLHTKYIAAILSSVSQMLEWVWHGCGVGQLRAGCCLVSQFLYRTSKTVLT